MKNWSMDTYTALVVTSINKPNRTLIIIVLLDKRC